MWPLQRDLRHVLALVAETDIALRRLRIQPGHDLLPIRGIYTDKKPPIGQPIDKNVVLDAAFMIADKGILSRTGRKLHDVVGRHMLEKGHGIPTLDHDPAHVTHIEEAYGRPHRLVLLDHAAVLHRHLPAGEIYQLGVKFAMVLNERRAFHREVNSGLKRRLGRSMEDPGRSLSKATEAVNRRLIWLPWHRYGAATEAPC